MFKIIKTWFKRDEQDKNKLDFMATIELEVATGSLLYHNLPHIIANKMADELLPLFKDKLMKDDKFMKELMNEFRLTVAQKILKNETH